MYSLIPGRMKMNWKEDPKKRQSVVDYECASDATKIVEISVDKISGAKTSFEWYLHTSQLIVICWQPSREYRSLVKT